MAIDVAPSRIATEQLQMIPFGSLIGAPLDAAITAQGQAALTSAEFIRSVGLQEVELDSGKKVLEAITVSFTFTDSSGNATSLVVPLLAIIPIPYIGIDDISINFKANISAESSTSLSTTVSNEFKASTEVEVRWWFVKANFKASYSSKKDSTSTANSKYAVEYTMDVSVHASQADMPKGLGTVLQILNDNIVSRAPLGDIIVTLSTTRLGPGESVELRIAVVNGSNRGLAKVTPVVESKGADLTVETQATETDDFGQSTATLKAADTITDGPKTVAVEVKVDSLDLKDTFDIVVG